MIQLWPRRPALAALLTGLAAWSAAFIYRTTFVLDGRRIFCLFDDAMISMTYARNLVEGHGLNWARRGAPVEGFTHPLWTALMVPVNLLPLPLDRRSLVMQLAGLVFLALNVVLVGRLTRRYFGRPGAHHWMPAAILTAFYYPLDFWALIGMEAGLQALLLTAMVLLAFDIAVGRRDRHLALFLVSAAAVALRLDMLLLVVAVQLWLWWCGGLEVGRREAATPNRSWRLGLLLLLLSIVGYEAFRWLYFHDILPNTYYLKLRGVPLVVRLLRGGSVMLDTLKSHGALLPLLALGVLPQLFARRRDAGAGWGARLALPTVLFTLCCAYSVYVGGDAWEDDVRANRFVAFAVPLLFVLWTALCNQLLEALAAFLARYRQRPPRYGRALAGIALAAATVVALLWADGLWLQDNADDDWQALSLLTRPLHTDKYEAIVAQLRHLQQVADPQAAVAVTWAGITAYFSDFKMVDILGYNDRFLAHGPPTQTFDQDNYPSFVPGHTKWNMAYTLETQQPDVVLQLWGGHDAVTVLRQHGYRRVGDLWIDPSSHYIHLWRSSAPEPKVAGSAGAAPPAEGADEAEADSAE